MPDIPGEAQAAVDMYLSNTPVPEVPTASDVQGSDTESPADGASAVDAYLATEQEMNQEGDPWDLPRPADPAPMLRYAMGKNPDVQAEVHQLADRWNVPPGLVEPQLDTLKKQERLNALNPEDNPILAEFLSIQRNAEVAHDDIPILQKMESTLGAFNAGMLRLPEMLVGGTGELVAMGGRMVDLALPEFVSKPLQELEAQLDKVGVPAISEVTRDMANIPKQLGEYLSPVDTRQEFAPQVAYALGDVSSQIVLALTAPELLMPSLFTSGVEQQAARQEATGTKGSSIASDLALINAGMWTIITEKIGLDNLMNRIPPAMKSQIAAKLSDIALGAGAEAVQEIAEKVGQGLIEKYSTNPDAQIFEGWQQEATVAGTVGAIVRAILPGFQGNIKSQTTVDEIDTVLKSSTEQDVIETVLQQAQQSTTAKRDPKAFKEFLAKLPNNELIIDPIAFEGRAELPAYIADQLDGSGSPVKVSIAEFTKEALMTPEVIEAIRPHVRLSESTLTKAELDAGDGVATIRNLVTQANEAKDSKTRADALWQQTAAELTATGRMSSVSAKYSTMLIPEYITTAAKLRGVSVEEITDLFTVKVEKLPPTFDDKKITSEYSSVGGAKQKVVVREQKQAVYDRHVKRADVIKTLRDCVNG